MIWEIDSIVGVMMWIICLVYLFKVYELVLVLLLLNIIKINIIKCFFCVYFILKFGRSEENV